MKAVKVRIAVAVAPDGNWCCGGYSKNDSPADSEEVAIMGLDEDGYVVHWITADVPVPEPQEIAGEVER